MNSYDEETNKQIRRDVRWAMTLHMLRLAAYFGYLVIAAFIQLWALTTFGGWGLLLLPPLVVGSAAIMWWGINAPDPWEKDRL